MKMALGILASVALMAVFMARPAEATSVEPVDPNPMKMERIQLDNGRSMILQGGRAYAVNRVGVKRKILVDAKFKAKDGSIITINRGMAYIQRPPRSAKSPRPAGLTLEEAARRAGVTYKKPQ